MALTLSFQEQPFVEDLVITLTDGELYPYIRVPASCLPYPYGLTWT